VARIADFVLLKRNGTRIWIPQRLVESSLLRAVRDPDELLRRRECRIIKDERKTRVGCVAVTVGGASTSVYVKRYNAFSWRYKLLSLFFRSGALRSLRGAMVLMRIGVRTGMPLAAVESRCWGLLSQSFYVSEEIASGQTSDIYWRKNLRPLSGVNGFRRRRKFLQELAHLFYQLHGAGIYHNDLKDANILVRSDANGSEGFYLLDLDGVRHCFLLSSRRRVKNLVQLNRTLGRLLRNTEKLYWLQHYLGPEFAKRNVLRWWLRQILRATKRADQKLIPRTKRFE
jgi:serine/threonine protein kinase